MPDSCQEEADLVRRAVDGDADAFGALYLQFLERIFRYVYFRTGDARCAEDLVEDVFLRAWKALPGYRPAGKGLLAWLYRIAHNVVVDYHRQQRPVTSLPAVEEMGLHASQPAALEKVIVDEDMANLAQAIVRLPVEQQQVIILRFVEGLSHAEVARILDKSPVHCRVLQHRALAALNQLLSSREEVAGC